MDDKDFKLICGIILSVLVGFGTVGNLVSLVTWRNGRRCKEFAGATYLTALALSDTLVLCTSGLKSVIEMISGLNIWHLNEILCKILHTTWHLFFLISTWVIVGITIERTLAVCQPLKAWKSCSKRREIVVVCFLTFVNLLLQLPFTVGAKLLPAAAKNDTITILKNTTDVEGNMSATSERKCQADPASFYFKYENAYHNWFMDFGLLFSAPLGILFVCNVIILIKVKRRDPVLQEPVLKQKPEVPSTAMTARVVALCLTLALSVGPYSIAALIPNLMSENKAISTVFNDRLMMILLLIWYVNNCSNFILYSLTGRAFRRDCAAIFCRRFYRHPSFTSSTVSRNRTIVQKSFTDVPDETSNTSASVDDRSKRNEIIALSSSHVFFVNMRSLDDVW